MTGEKVPSKRKVPSIKEIKKPLTIGGIVAAVAIAGIVGGIYILRLEEKKMRGTLICRLEDIPWAIDPLYEIFAADALLIFQVAEGLFRIDQTREDNPVINNLATAYEWSEDYLNFTCTLRKGVQFHDGAPFNASAVQWNFNRLFHFLDTMPWGIIYQWDYGFINNEGQRVINRTEVLDTYTIRFVLNKPYIPFRALLTIPSTYMLSPKSTPADDFIDINSTKLIGTGPFMLETCTTYWGDYYIGGCINATLIANPNYWNGKPLFDKLIFTDPYIDNGEVNRLNGMLSKELNFVIENNQTNLEIFRENPNITIVDSISQGISYISMNNLVIPVEMRKAISYAFNYTSYLDIYHEGEGDFERVRSPILKHMLYSNWKDFDVPYYNITIARQTLKDANWNGTLGLSANEDVRPGNPWETKAKSSTPLAIYNFSYAGSDRSRFAPELVRMLQQIGVKVVLDDMNWPEWFTKTYAGEFELNLVGWGASFNDPVEIINPLFSSKADGVANFIHFNDTQVQQWMDDTVEEPDPSAREQLYFKIQERLIETLYPRVWLYTPILHYAWQSNIKGIPLEGHPYRILFKDGYFV